MNKKTISAILTAIMICLTIAIVVLCIKISLRGPKPLEEEKTDAEIELAEEEIAASANQVEETYEAHYDIVAIPNTSSSVNVRSGPGTDYDRIGSAYSNCEYVVYEILPSGWTKLDYDGQNGYISSEFLEYKQRQDLGDGTYSYDEVTEDLTDYKAE